MLVECDRYRLNSLPLVIVIIVNFNYGRFLEETVNSVFNQTYKKIECIIIDDHSTDGSLQVIASLEKKYSSLRYIVNRVNSGQSFSSYEGFRNTKGAYVIFLDADDYLFPECIEAHVEAHLSLRLPVGFTSVDMCQIENGDTTVCTSQGFSDFVISRKGKMKDLCRSTRIPCSDTALYLEHKYIEKIHYVHPKFSYLWPWSPTSGNCFRRAALELVIHNESFYSLRSCSDIYLLRGVAALTGSALIDEPLAGYRIHGSNSFIKTATIHQVRVFDLQYLSKNSRLAMTLIIDHLVETASTLIDRMESPDFYITALNTLDKTWPPIITNPRELSYLTSKIIQNKKLLSTILSKDVYNDWIIRKILDGNVHRRRRSFWRRLLGIIIIPAVYPALLLMYKTKRHSAAATQRPKGAEKRAS